MEDKIEVNEYVRLARNQGINKIIDKENDRYVLESEIADSYGDITFFLYECELKDEIVKHSKQLIDLVEVEDIVEIRTGLHSSFKYFVENEDNLLLLEEQVKQFWNIETILTKEQYMTNCYKVGGEDGI